ncbi:hypothetical protein Shyd_15520 [Streptomyces hydrogenans]|uniref:Uncharacterized protein n=1 Tax=Streptomyces hydrogenans TaxID=1873719 RepID=A0ABQ3P580_9ACTN|nr:hypothetical protein GCM10018784_67850 [Streptomyces hydrogenans]GHI20181.1 hypothetical protein Shyd_15520 [Streptomyces hydrogenans]
MDLGTGGRRSGPWHDGARARGGGARAGARARLRGRNRGQRAERSRIARKFWMTEHMRPSLAAPAAPAHRFSRRSGTGRARPPLREPGMMRKTLPRAGSPP